MIHKKTYTYAYHRKGVAGPCYARKTVYGRPSSNNRKYYGNSTPFLDFFCDCVTDAMKAPGGKSTRR